ncbi:MAG: proline--tRNA ligase [Alphaproteobacteria bacterium]
MKYSNFFISTQKDVSKDVKLISHSLMLKSGMIRQETSGIYSWLPIGFRVLKKVIEIIEEIHNHHNINQILMPTIQSADIWKKSNRYESYGKEMLKITDRHDKELLYGPTNEEMITAIGKHYLKSYKELPLNLYHIQSKFRDEIRPRFGVMRAREFLMKDAYSFDLTDEDCHRTYINYFRMYLLIFRELGIPIIPVKAPSGEIGGSLSHEFHLIVDSGESEIYFSEELLENNLLDLEDSELINIRSYTSDFDNLNIEKDKLIKKKSIELGHIFLFGQKYSKPFDLQVDTMNGKIFPYMGSYGIGISRIPAAVIEKYHDNKGIVWPKEISPFQLTIINLLTRDESCCNYANSLYENLKKKKLDIFLDDRDESAGKKFADADLSGIPLKLIIGKKFLNDNLISMTLRSSESEELVHISKVEDYVYKFIKNTTYD